MADFADDYLQRHPNIFGIPELHLDPSLTSSPPVADPSFEMPELHLDPALSLPSSNPLPGPRAVGGDPLAPNSNPFSHYTDPPDPPDVTLGYGATAPVNDPSSATYNLGRGPLVPTLGVDQAGTVTAGMSAGTGSVGVAVNTQGVVQGQVGGNISLGGAGELDLQANTGSDHTVGGSVAWQNKDKDLRIGANGGIDPTNGQGNIGFGISGRF